MAAATPAFSDEGGAARAAGSPGARAAQSGRAAGRPSASWLVALALLVAVVRAPAADATAARAPDLDGAVFSGCASVSADGACAIDRGATLRVWIPDAAGAPWYEIDGAPAVLEKSEDVRGGARAALAVPGGARELTVHARHGASFTLRLAAAAPPPPSVTAARELRDRGELGEARARLLADLPRAERAADPAPVLAALARIALASGDDDEADAWFDRSSAAAEAAGSASNAADDAFAHVFSLLGRGRFAEARAALARASDASRRYPDGQARAVYYEGWLASKTGDRRVALRSFREAGDRATRLGMPRLPRMAEQQAAMELDAIGRTDEALDALLALDAADPGGVSPCDRGDLAANVGWVALHQRAPWRVDPRAWLTRAIATYRAGCRDAYDASWLASTLEDLARAELERGDVAAARDRLAEADASAGAPKAAVALERLALRADLAMATGDVKHALDTYRSLGARAAALGEGEWERAGLEGEAEALAKRGDAEGAAARLARAAAIADRQAPLVPLGEGRDGFAAAHERSDARRARLLVSLGRPEEALRALRRARGRSLASLAHHREVASLDPERRDRWARAAFDYRREREAIERDAAADWSLAGDTLAAALERRSARSAAARRALDEALAAVLEGRARGDGATAAPPPERELVLAFFPGAPGWLAFAQTTVDGRTTTRAEDLGAVDAAATDEALSAALLAPFRREIERARRVAVVASGAARAIDVHALPWDGAPLVARVPVVYPIDREGGAANDDGGDERGARSGDGADLPRTRALVVGDPTSDLEGARAEIDGVRAALEAGRFGVDVLRGRAATGSAVWRALAGASLFHYAGHGRYAGRDGWESALPLAEHGELTVADVLSLPRAPRRVVLLGCETARSSNGERDAGDGIGLAQAFLVAGAEEVVAATRGVDDGVAPAIAGSLYEADAPGRGLDEALRASQIAAWRARRAGWSALRVLVR